MTLFNYSLKKLQRSAFILLILVSSFHVHAQKFDYESFWQKVYRFELRDLPKSASSVVDSIYQQAKQDRASVQLTKALLYKSKFLSILEEESQLKIVDQFRREIAQSSFPTRNILENILAKIYWEHAQQNRWRTHNRSTSPDSTETDFRLWDLTRLHREIGNRYLSSLENASALFKLDLNSVADLIEGDLEDRKYRPTLYDFLAQNAIEFFQTEESYVDIPFEDSNLTDQAFFSQSSEFLNLQLAISDSTVGKMRALAIYQELLQLHANDSLPEALVMVDLERLSFLKDKAVVSNKDQHYEEALLHLRNKYEAQEIYAEISFALADFYYEQGGRYLAGIVEPYQFKKVESLKICREIKAKFPDTRAAKNAVTLEEIITNEEIQVEFEQYIPVNTPSRLLITYRNVDSVQFEILRITEAQAEELRHISEDSPRRAFFQSLPSAEKWSKKLRTEYDHQLHNTEVLFPALNPGSYVLITSPIDTQKDIFVESYLQVTDLTIVKLDLNNGHSYQVINRNNGKPVSGAKVHLSNKQTKAQYKFDRSFVTDANGLYSFKTNRSFYDLKTSVSHGADQAIFMDYSLYNSNDWTDSDDDEHRAKVSLFTDRSIYRPGQTVYFKGIFLQKKGKSTSIVANEEVIVTLYDANEDEVDELTFTTNEFGSFSGEFELPKTTLTGMFSIEVDEGYEDSEFYDELLDDFEYSTINFSVEEYKRPTFEVQFDKVKALYAPNDSVTVSGKAISFSGATLTNAIIEYTIVRNVRFPGWRYWQYGNHTSSPVQIAQDEIETDHQGAFQIPFKAIADPDVDPADNPIFEYTLGANVTDINGETRSASSTVNISYQVINLSIGFPDRVERAAASFPLEISTLNLNSVFVPAKGTARVYRMRSQATTFRDRPWPHPDYQLFSEEEFRKLFPNDTYHDEDLVNDSVEPSVIFEVPFDTETSTQLQLNQLSDLALGTYLLEVRVKDPSGTEILEKKKFTLSDNLKETIVENKIFSIASDKASYMPGDIAKIYLASAVEGMTVHLAIAKNGQKSLLIPVHLNKEVKEIKLELGKDDIGKLEIDYHYAVYNDFKSGSFFINIPYQKQDLTIETASFRDRLKPGGDEKWAFKITGEQAGKIEAEVLASMYDASLDDFTSHNWQMDAFDRRYQNDRTNPNAYRSFSTHSTGNGRRWHWINYEPLDFPALRWFGFSLVGNESVNQEYLQLLKWQIKTVPVQSQLDLYLEDGFVKGKVMSELGEPLPAVAVHIKGTGKFVTADESGAYKVKVKKGQVLFFRYLGFHSLEVKVGVHNVINVTMEPYVNNLDEVVVTAYGITRDKRSLGYAVSSVTESEFGKLEDSAVARILRGKVPGVDITQTSGIAGSGTNIIIRGYSSISGTNQPLFVIDGVPFNSDRGFTSGGATASSRFLDMDPNNIADINVLKGAGATTLYGEAARNGVVIITTNSGQKAQEKELAKLKVRKNFKETAFFLPHLTTNRKGEVSFNFTAPEALTRWKLQLLAHTKAGETGELTKTAFTQKELMVMPNLPRFFRAGDTIEVSSKVVNLTDKPMVGTVALYLENPSTGTSIEAEILQSAKLQHIEIPAKGNAEVSWTLSISDDVDVIQYKVVGKAGNFSDGEQKAIPVLTNKVLVTETLPLWVKGKEDRRFTLEKLKNNSSATLKHHRLTLEMTSNPAWYAIQSLPYLMEYPYECAEQTFSRLYANALASEVINSQPKVKAVFDQWAASGALSSKLEANPELKSLLIEETPWLRDAQSEAAQKKRLALLFDLSKMRNQFKSTAFKLRQNQLDSGGFSWFSGGRWASATITQHVVIGFGHLRKLGVSWEDDEIDYMLEDAIDYLEEEIVERYQRRLKSAYRSDHINSYELEYLYMRSFYDTALFFKDSTAYDYYLKQGQQHWKEFNLHNKGLMALIAHRNGDSQLASAILEALKENSITNDELGMYWKANKPGWGWYQSPIETQALLIEVFTEIEHDNETINNLKTWLLKKKQANSWKTTKATASASYALLLQGSDWLSIDEVVDVQIAQEPLTSTTLKNIAPEAGTGYFKTSWTGDQIKNDMAVVDLSQKNEGIAWGSLYWQYFEDLDKITSAETPLKIKKQLFLKKNTSSGEQLIKISPDSQLKVGDLIRVRIELSTDREMEFIHMKDMRAAGLEPLNVLSGHKYQDGLSYYESTRDAATNFFFDELPKGQFVFEYDLRVNNAGDFSNGITTIQSMYAPEFTSQSEGVRVKVGK